MVAFAHLLASVICLSRLSATLAAYIPPQKRDNTTCCGYVVANRNEGYYRFKHEINFDQLSSIDKVFEAGWKVSNGWQAGGKNEYTGQIPMANENNVDLVKGQGLRLKVPRQDQNAKTFSVAEVSFPDTLLGAVIEIEAKLTSVSGTCMGMFTIHADGGLDKPFGWHDEQDIEILGSTMLRANEFLPAGMQMVNYEPSTGAKSWGNQLFPTGIDPSQGFHTYSIAWYPTTSDSNTARLTEYRFDGATINRPGQFPSANPSALIINHWTNGDGQWSGGPPAQDVYLTIKRVLVYYDKPKTLTTGTGVLKGSCSRAQACRVNV